MSKKLSNFKKHNQMFVDQYFQILRNINNHKQILKIYANVEQY